MEDLPNQGGSLELTGMSNWILEITTNKFTTNQVDQQQFPKKVQELI